MEASRAAFLIGIAMLIGGFSAGFLWEVGKKWNLGISCLETLW